MLDGLPVHRDRQDALKRCRTVEPATWIAPSTRREEHMPCRMTSNWLSGNGLVSSQPKPERGIRPLMMSLRPTAAAVQTILRHRFGDQPFTSRLAWRLVHAHWDTAVRRALEARSLDDLVVGYLEYRGS